MVYSFPPNKIQIRIVHYYSIHTRYTIPACPSISVSVRLFWCACPLLLLILIPPPPIFVFHGLLWNSSSAPFSVLLLLHFHGRKVLSLSLSLYIYIYIRYVCCVNVLNCASNGFGFIVGCHVKQWIVVVKNWYHWEILMGNGDDSGCFFPLTSLQIG